MVNFEAVFKILAVYLLLSKSGKRFLKKAVGRSLQANKTSSKPVGFNLQILLNFINDFKVCDKVFSAQVSDRLCAVLGRKKSVMYSRFVSYGWVSLLMWSRVLEAFDLDIDEGAKERCVLVAFTHREWNDLFDNQGYNFSQLFSAFDYQAAIPQQLSFLRQLKQMERKLAPPDRFGKFYQHMQGFDICSLFEYTPQKAQIILDQVAPFVALIFMYIMVPEVPGELKETLKPIARWLYMLDELADLEHDQRINRVTYMGMVKDPQEVMQAQFQQCCEVILRNAPHPDKLIKFMEVITSRVIDASKRGTDIESSFFNIS